MGNPTPSQESDHLRGKQITVSKRLLRRVKFVGLVFLALVGVIGVIVVVNLSNGGDRQTQAVESRIPIAVLPLKSGEAAVVLKARDLALHLGDNVRIVVTPRNGQGIAHLVPGRILSYDGVKAIVAVAKEEASRYEKDFADGLGIIASPGERR